MRHKACSARRPSHCSGLTHAHCSQLALLILISRRRAQQLRPAHAQHTPAAIMSAEGGAMGTHKTPNDPVKEQIAQDKFGKSYDELDAHQRIQVGGTKGGITTKEGDYGGHYKGEGTHTNVEHTGDAVKEGGGSA